jgi:hypothetical protein
VGFVDVLFPVVHVLTAGAESLTLTVDGKDRGEVRPSGSEYASSLREIRVLLGPRRFAARSLDGHERDPVTFDVRPGRDYLYAPDSRGTCFRVEAAGYGRSATPVTVEPLDPSRAFWEIEPRLDLWLSPLPAPSPDTRSSGGTARTLRRSPCGESGGPAPAEMRSPAGFETPDE